MSNYNGDKFILHLGTMFKKQLDFKAQSILKNSDRKKLQERVPSPLPSKVSQALFSTAEVKKGTMYYDASNGTPIYFEVRGGEPLPALNTLILYPEIASLRNSSPADLGDHIKIGSYPMVLTHKAVIDRLINGADLMIRGCIGQFPESLNKGVLAVIVDYKRPDIAIAVGVCKQDVGGMSMEEGRLLSGVLIEVIHVMGDKLSALGKPVDELLERRKERINDKEIVRLIAGSSLEEFSDSSDEEEQVEEVDLNAGVTSDKEPVKEVLIAPTNVEVTIENDKYQLTTQDIDLFFERAILYSISQDTLDLPIKSTQFIESHVLKNLPPTDVNQVNIKKTSWKKGAKFLKAMEKINLLKLKGKDDNLVIISVAAKTDPRIENFHPYRIRGLSKPDAVKSDEPLKDNELVLQALYKPTQNTRPLYNALDIEYNNYYTLQEITQQIQRYIKKENVVAPNNPKDIIPDKVLKGFGIKSQVKRAMVMDQVLLKYSPYHLLYRKSDLTSTDPMIQRRLLPSKGVPPKILISIEKIKVGKRFVTRVACAERFFIDMEELASQMRVKCMGSTTFNEPENPKDGKEVTVQGKHNILIVNLLKSHWGINENWCIVSDKVKIKPKK